MHPHLRSSQDIRHLTWSPSTFEAAGELTEVDGGQVFSVTLGESNARQPIVYLHGIPTWSWIWRNVMTVTSTQHLSISLDLPGFGRSILDQDSHFEVSTLAGMLQQAIDHLLDETLCPVIVAHDFGALVAGELIAGSPSRYSAVVMTNTSLRPEAWGGSGSTFDPLSLLRIRGLGQVSMALARPWMLRAAAAPFVADPVDDHWFDGFWYPFDHGFGQSLARFFQSTPLRAEDFDRWRVALSNFPGQSLVVWGGRDPAFGTQDLLDVASLLPNAETMVIDRASHFLMEDRPRVLGRRINAILSGTG